MDTENTFAKKVQKADGECNSGLDTKRKMAGRQLWSHFDRYEKQFIDGLYPVKLYKGKFIGG